MMDSFMVVYFKLKVSVHYKGYGLLHLKSEDYYSSGTYDPVVQYWS